MNQKSSLREQPNTASNTEIEIQEYIFDLKKFDIVPDAEYAPLEGLAPGSAEAQARQRETIERLGLPLEIKTKITGIRFRLIPPGKFLMGSPDSEPHRQKDERQHRVTITKPFYMGKYEVTQAQWERVMGTNPSHFQTLDDNLPVERVAWYQSNDFCTKLCELEGVSPQTFRLPTEAEWEYACRAGTTTAYYRGNECDSTVANISSKVRIERTRMTGFFAQKPVVDVAYEYRAATGTRSVGSYPANAFGLYDMHGNVWEWCVDWYEEIYSVQVEDPSGPEKGKMKVLRGGSWSDKPEECRAAQRNSFWNTYSSSNVGFRLVLQISHLTAAGG